MSNRTILVTGGAGYIGSHVVRQLLERGERVLVLDNLSKGFRQALMGAELVVGEVGDQTLVSRLMAERQVDTVMHFAAHTIVPESVALPLKYYGNNTCSTRSLAAGLDRSRGRAFRIFVDRGGLRDARGRLCRRGFADPAHQRLRYLEAHERMDAARCRGGKSPALRGIAVLQRGRLRPGRPHRPSDPRGNFANQSGLRGHGRQAQSRVHLRDRLSHPRWNGRTRLPARRRSGRCAPAGPRLSALQAAAP